MVGDGCQCQSKGGRRVQAQNGQEAQWTRDGATPAASHQGSEPTAGGPAGATTHLHGAAAAHAAGRAQRAAAAVVVVVPPAAAAAPVPVARVPAAAAPVVVAAMVVQRVVPATCNQRRQ